MSMSMIAVVMISNVVMYITLPLHMRLLHVLLFPSKNIKLDQSFHTLMINSTIGNFLFSLIFCVSQAPAGAGLWYDFYMSIGPVLSHVEMIKSSPIIILTSCLHLVLAASRFTAIAFPLRHHKIWERVNWLCFVMWICTILISIPLMIPGSTAHYTMKNVFDIPSVHYTFLGNYFQIYSVIGSFFAAVVELLTILFYIAMIAKFRVFRKLTNSTASDVRKMTMGVVRTTVSAVMTSMGSWIIVIFFVLFFSYSDSTGSKLLDDLQFSSIFVLLNAINNVLTPWVLLASFPNVRATFFNLLPKKNATSENRSASFPKTKTVVTYLSPKTIVPRYS